MKETKDKICNPDSPEFTNRWIKKAALLNINYVAIETPYDSPVCGNSVSYTKQWVKSARANGLRVWHRHMPLAFEGIYDVTKVSNIDYLTMISKYIVDNPTLFANGDIFTPIPEPQNGGIAGITYCPQGVCQFYNAAHFNSWLREAIRVSRSAFYSIGLTGVKIGYYGFDGFVAWGHNNPDWNGILEDSTIAAMGNITIDHYPQLVGTTMAADLDELEARYPGVPIIIGEWGAVNGTNHVSQVRSAMKAAQRTSVRGFNYWHMGMGGNEALIRRDFSNRIHYPYVQKYFGLMK
jgi:hypothetical protein